MKKLLIILLSALTLTAMAQKPRIAIYMAGDDPMNEIIANRLMDGLLKSGRYMPVERSAEFLAAVNKEHAFERTGEVDEEQIAKLGIQYGIQYICVVSVLDVWKNEKYITSRILDASSAEVIGSCSSNGSITDGGALMSTLDDLSQKLTDILDYSKKGNTKRIAVYVSKTGNRDVDVILGDQLVAGFARSGEYLAVERTNAFLNQIQKEAGYQQSGAVNDEDLFRLGKKFGVQYVCIAKTILWGGAYFISSRIIDVETNEVPKMYNAENKVMNSSKDVLAVAQEIAEHLSETFNNKGYTETAWGINMKMTWVEGGEFMMGCTSEQGICNDDANIVRRVKLKDFYIGVLEITQEQWEKVTGGTIYRARDHYNSKDANLNSVGKDFPMYYVSWNDAMMFCRLLSEKTGKTYTLPTEAQWEYAARGGKFASGTKYAGSNTIDDVAWYLDNNAGSLHPCGQKQANALGIYDMSGNAWEWCKDGYKPQYNPSELNNPTGPTDDFGIKVLRGGSCYENASGCRVAARFHGVQSYAFSNVGFRVVCIP